MEAPVLVPARKSVGVALFAVLLVAASSIAQGATYVTKNFRIYAPTPELAQEVGEAAERWRRELALEWIGEEMPDWSKPCPIKARIAPNLGAGGVTTFVFDRGEVFNWNMSIQGSRERVLDSVLPHEITHTIFACYFRQPVPRWADEGACTTVEHDSEIAKQENLLIQFLKTGKGIAFSDMFAMKEYPQDVLPLYAQGHSLTRFLIGQQGKAHFLQFLADGMSDENWPRAVREHYGHDSLYALQNDWLEWVRKGRPVLAGELESQRRNPGVAQVTGEQPILSAIAPETPEVRAQSPAVTPASHESAYSQHRDATIRR